MFKLTAFIFLTVQVVLEITACNKVVTKVDTSTVDLPPEILNCLDNIIIPATRTSESVYQSCLSLPPDNERLQCIRNNNRVFGETEGVSKCQNNINELQLPTQRTLAFAYELNGVRKDRYSEVPQNVLDCIDSLKPMLQRAFQRAKDCESSVSVDSEADKANHYKECEAKMQEMIRDQFSKCEEMTRPLNNEQHLLLQTYLLKVFANL